jgi:membrane-bound lytic murein transglycosylase D
MKKEDRYDSLFQFYADRVKVDWKLLKAQARAESALDPDAQSHVGALGLSQFMPATWSVDIRPRVIEFYETNLGLRKYRKYLSPSDPEDAILGQALYMKQLLGMFNNTELALAAYNWGMGNIKRLISKVNSNHFEDLRKNMPLETQNYVKTIMLYYNQI